ncbi:triple tyrosine motif-containing protein [Candidatus Pelagibacter sp. RS40]|uniref:triple tyrosine motif-containing protein n=1 Tax=Candidatus Pelagibacter sp. RS40 TaxID=1977865 RepID=UPI000A15E3BE|nr:triple tyrosine motif-containing protein [Candidatus Pelagibacter sp. RS40]ARJ49622.1 hypothetical protein B8063_06295 [Candidatus Pelagibacter sp. RS40]|tara:strand:- start:35 stop:2587 length:2553 start_codon:yes stop_codon:yes gene_type:complete
MFKFFINILLFSLIITISKAKQVVNYPIPEITNYPPEVNGGFTSNWGITEGLDGKLYFANNYGVLVYDGKTWSNIILDNNDPARSIATDKLGNIIVGSRGNFGFISNNGSGDPIYKSLNKYLDDKNYKNRDIIYETFSLADGQIFFRSLNNLFFYKDKKIKVIKKVNKRKFGVSRLLNDEIFIALIGDSIATINDHKIIKIKNSEIFKDKTVTGFHKSKTNELVVFTRKNGVYKQTDDGFLKINNEIINNIGVIYRTFGLVNNKIGLATYEGLFILDNSLKPIAHYNSNSGLRVDNIRSIYQDQNGIIWAGLDDGISKINENSKFKFYDLKSSNLNSRVRSLNVYQDHLYVGTNVDLKKLVLDNNGKLKESFIQIGKEKLNTQVWETFISNDKLLIGSNAGLGVIDNSENYELAINKKDIGIVFEIIESKIFKDYLLVRSKKGIFLINKFNLKDYRKIYKGSGVGYLNELEERDEIWFRVSKKGIFRFKIENNNINKTKFDEKIFTEGKVKLFYINNNLIIYANKNYLEYDFLKERFKQSDLFSKIINIKNKEILDLKKTNINSYWVTFTERIEGKRVQEFYEIDSDGKILKLPFENISHHLDTEFFFFNNLTLMSSNEGIVIINDKDFNNNQTGSAIISKIVNNDQKVFFGAPNKDLVNNTFKIKQDFKFNQNKISFTISLTDYFYENKNKYRYQLVGFDEKFSDFTYSHNITYTNLKPGKYDFKIQGLNSNGVLSEINNYSFYIDYPWWQSKIFYIVEFIIFSILLITTLFLKQTGKAAALATSISFMMILAFFEYINFVLDPLILDLSNGVPVFSIFSKVLLGLILLPLERLINSILDKMAKKIKVN